MFQGKNPFEKEKANGCGDFFHVIPNETEFLIQVILNIYFL